MRSKTINLTGYIIQGTSTINLWGGGQGDIPMTPVKIPLSEFSKTSMLRAVNDGQFGCESIQDARIDIYSTWDNGSKEYERSIFVNHPLHTVHFLDRGI